MLEIMILLLCVFIVLLVVQILALLRVRQLINRLKLALMDKKIIVHSSKQKSESLSQNYRKCQFCKHRQTYINATIHGGENDFYYRCSQHNTEVTLTHTCADFEFEDD